MEKVKLKVFGITYSQVQDGAYALVLSQVDGLYRIPIVVGTAEAQSIAVKLEGINPARPMTHDLFRSFVQAFGITLDEVFIYKFQDGIFYSELKFNDGVRQISIDARTSDAIAIAMRTKSPIYTTDEILKTTGFIFEDRIEGELESNDSIEKRNVKIENLAIPELEKMMQQCVSREEYEHAAEIKNIIMQKKKNLRNENK